MPNVSGREGQSIRRPLHRQEGEEFRAGLLGVEVVFYRILGQQGLP